MADWIYKKGQLTGMLYYIPIISILIAIMNLMLGILFVNPMMSSFGVSDDTYLNQLLFLNMAFSLFIIITGIIGIFLAYIQKVKLAIVAIIASLVLQFFIVGFLIKLACIGLIALLVYGYFKEKSYQKIHQ